MKIYLVGLIVMIVTMVVVDKICSYLQVRRMKKKFATLRASYSMYRIKRKTPMEKVSSERIRYLNSLLKQKADDEKQGKWVG